VTNPSSHGLTEVLYAYSSLPANNGSAFAGLASNTNWYNPSGIFVIGIGRYGPIVLMLAMTGPVLVTAGTMTTEGKLFAGVRSERS
jgi:K+-transporting ATPase ATPase A chain